MRRLTRPALAAATLFLCCGPLAAADPAPRLSRKTAALAHVEVAKLYASPLGEALRQGGVWTPDSAAMLKAATGLKATDIESVTLQVVAHETGPDVLAWITLAKPLDLDGMQKFLGGKEVAGVTRKDGVLTLAGGGGDPTVVVDATNPLAPSVAFRTKLAQPAGERPATALASVRGDSKALVTVALQPGVFPLNAFAQQLKAGTLPPEYKQFLPLLDADLAVVRLDSAAAAMPLTVTVTADDEHLPAVRKALPKVKLLLTTLMRSFQDAPEAKGDKVGGALVADLLPAVEKAAVAEVPGGATLALALPAPFPSLVPALRVATGFDPAKPAADAEGVTFAGLRENAARSANATKLKQFALAMHNYESANGNGFPAAFTADKAGKPLHSWRIAMLPYIEETPLYQKFKLDEPWDSEHNKKVVADNPMPKSFLLEGVSKPTDKTTHFQVFNGNGAAFDGAKRQRIVDFTDGMSNTILIGVAEKAVPWTKPDDMAFDPKGDPRKLLRKSGNVYLVAFADGSVRSVRVTVDEATMKGAITRGGGEVIDLP